MIEQIGRVTLDETWYPGEDLYSDGKVEDEILSIVTEHSGEEYNRIIAEKKDWAVMYHLSHLRGNIVEWLPIGPEDAVLEIGSGCGAVTGVLADKAALVDCIELSKKRSFINANRNRDRENITVLLGNFQDIEPNLERKYDWITLIGVFEYGQVYIDSATPYHDFLRRIATHLKPGGKVVIAIENRLGLKYFAGCTEDHCGIPFEGIEGYRKSSGARTFSKPELERILDESGFAGRSFYYPYPDYKFPMRIYSDDYLPRTGELRTNRNNFDRKRFVVFDESEAFDGLIESGLFPQFSNSFLVVAEKEKRPESEILFTKYSNERAARFALRTDILRGGQVRTVRKRAMESAGEAHIRSIGDRYEQLGRLYADSAIRINRCGMTESGLALEYLEGPTLEQVLDGYLASGNTGQLVDVLFEYLEEIKKGFTLEQFEMTDGFREVFGDVELPSGLLCGSPADIDLVVDNVLVSDGWTLIDYEWTFDFPIPYRYVVYRVLSYYLGGSTARGALWGLGLYERAGLSAEEIDVYERMERHFQDVYVVSEGPDELLFVPIRDLYDDISPGEVKLADLKLLGEGEREARLVQLYQAPDLNFTEERSEKRRLYKDGVFLNYFPVEPDARFVRLDPCSKYCVVRSLRMQWGPEIGSYRTNGVVRKDGSILFAVEDPQIIVRRPKGAEGDFRAYFEIEYLNMEEALYQLQREYGAQRTELDRTRAALSQREELIRQMENTKVWKAYRKIKGDRHE